MRLTPASGRRGSILTSSAALSRSKSSVKAILLVTASSRPVVRTRAGSGALHQIERQLRDHPVRRPPYGQLRVLRGGGVSGELVLEDQLPAGDRHLVEIAQRPARIERRHDREQRLEVDLAVRRLLVGAEAAQTDRAVGVPGEDEARRRGQQRGGCQHAAREQRAQADPDLDLRQLEQDLAIGALGADVDADQLDRPRIVEAQLGVAHLDPDPPVGRRQRPLDVRGEPGQLDRAGWRGAARAPRSR